MPCLRFSQVSTRLRETGLRTVLAGSAAILLCAPAHAADDNWNNATASYQLWSTGANWDQGTVPTGAQSAAIANGGWAKIDSTVAFSTLTIGGTSRVQLLDGANLSGGGAITNNNVLITANSGALTVSNAIAGSGSLSVAGNGVVTLTGVNTYTGPTTIAAGSTLAVSGGGTIVNSNVGVTGTFDISQFTRVDPAISNVDLSSLSGSGTIALGAQVLTVRGGGNFSGVITDGGIGGGTGGSFAVRGGTLTLTGVSTFHGQAGAASNATLALAGNGSIANAFVSGAFDISQTTSGATVIGVINGGTTAFVSLGSKTLTIANATPPGPSDYLPNPPFIYLGVIQDGGIGGGSGGGVTMASGFQELSNTNSYTGVTTVSGGMLVIGKTDVITSSSGAVLTGGTLDVSIGGASIKTLSGSGGIVALGSKTLTITAASGSFSGALQDAGGVGNRDAIRVNGLDVLIGGSLNLAGGSLILTGANTYTGTTTVGAGALLRMESGGSVASTSALAVNGGTFDLNGQTQTVGALSGTGGAVTLGAGALTTNSTASTNLASIISGSGSLAKADSGTLTLTGINTYTGGTNVAAGTLQISGSGTLGGNSGALTVSGGALDLGGTTQTQNGGVSLTGGTIQNGTLSSSGTFALQSGSVSAVLAGSGGVSKMTSGTVTLSGINTYAGGTTVGAGTLNVTGKVAAVSVSSGGTLTGAGTVGSTSVASGGTLSPGAGAALGTLTVSGNLTLASGAGYSTYFNPSATVLTAVSGTASVNGTLTANAASGSYTVGQRYTLMTATDGVSGTFASFTTPNLPSYLTGRLSYDANNVFLNLDASAITQSLGADAPPNQTSITTALDAAVSSGKTLNAGITSLYTLSGANLGTALGLATGDIGAKANQAAGQSFSPFFYVMMGRGATNDSIRVAAAGMPRDVLPAQLREGETDVWGTIYGGHTAIAADAATGASSLSSGAFGGALGIERMFDGEVLAGVSVGFGHQTFRSGASGGNSNDLMLGLYGRKNFGQAYASAALGYGWHDITTQRTVTVSGTDVLRATFTAGDLAGRIEGGYRLALDEEVGVTPFVAFAGQRFHTPVYAETNASGSSSFALAYADNDSISSRVELGGRLNRDFDLVAQTLSLEGMLAWAHQLSSRPSAQAAFQDLPGSGFVLLGIRPAADTALLGLGLQMHDTSGLVYGIRAQVQTGGGTDVITGTLNLAYHW
jgi:autotransporter-associated beta strand protein